MAAKKMPAKKMPAKAAAPKKAATPKSKPPVAEPTVPVFREVYREPGVKGKKGIRPRERGGTMFDAGGVPSKIVERRVSQAYAQVLANQQGKKGKVISLTIPYQSAAGRTFTQKEEVATVAPKGNPKRKGTMTGKAKKKK